MNKRIIEIRIDRDFFQKEIAYMLEITRSHYSNIENECCKYDCDIIFKLSLIYEVNPLYLYGINNNKYISNSDLQNLKKHYTSTLKRKEKVFSSRVMK